MPQNGAASVPLTMDNQTDPQQSAPQPRNETANPSKSSATSPMPMDTQEPVAPANGDDSFDASFPAEWQLRVLKDRIQKNGKFLDVPVAASIQAALQRGYTGTLAVEAASEYGLAGRPAIGGQTPPRAIDPNTGEILEHAVKGCHWVTIVQVTHAI